VTPEAQRIAIAEACGWTQIESCTCCDGVSRGYQPTPGAHKKHLPDYLNDLNAMHDAEKVLTNEQDLEYSEALEQVVKGRFVTNNAEDMRRLRSATAAQRAEAFLRTIGKWRECK
jgi:hypothetical protein